MARIRSIKPEFFTDEKLADLDPLARLAFEGLWCHADKAGRLEDCPRQLKVQILPYDKCDFDAILNSLADGKFILRYQVNGTKLIHIKNFEKHQRPHHTEKESTLPSHNGADTVKEPLDTRLITDGREGKGKEGKVAVPVNTVDETFEIFWSKYPRKVGKGTASKAWHHLSKKDREDASKAVEATAKIWASASPDRQRFCPHPTTWLNRRGWEDDLHAVESQAEVSHVVARNVLSNPAEERERAEWNLNEEVYAKMQGREPIPWEKRFQK